jgi:hypothetical protein
MGEGEGGGESSPTRREEKWGLTLALWERARVRGTRHPGVHLFPVTFCDI